MTTATQPQQRRPAPPANQSPPQTKALASVDLSERIASLEALSKTYSPTVLATLPDLTRAVTLARGIQEMRNLVAQVWPSVRHLMGTKLGFRTDRDNDSKGRGPYPDAVVIDVLTEALLRDVRWVGNEMNIISSGLYITREGYERKVGEIPGLTNLKLFPGIPQPHSGGAIVPFQATWKVEDDRHSIDRMIPVKLNNGMGDDGALGKAERKMLAAIYKRMTGTMQEEDDVVAELPPTERKALPATPPTAPPQPAKDAAEVEEYSKLFYAVGSSAEILAISDQVKTDRRLTSAGKDKLRNIATVLIRSFKTRESAEVQEEQQADGSGEQGDAEAVEREQPEANPHPAGTLEAVLWECDRETTVEEVDAKIRQINPEMTSRKFFTRLSADHKAALIQGLQEFLSDLDAR